MKNISRRNFIKQSACAAVGLAAGKGMVSAFAATQRRAAAAGTRVIVIGIDGMDPGLTEQLMGAGRLPNLERLRSRGGYRVLGTSIPPQSPVAWANFINGAGPGSHGIFDFIHRDPERQAYPFFAAAETVPGQGYLEWGEHKLQLDFWPFNHTPSKTVLKRQGTPFWDHLDRAGIPSTFYNLPSNYPPSPSQYGNHRCLSGMGTPDLQGSYGTYQHFAEDGPAQTESEGGGKRSRIVFEGDTSLPLDLLGPRNTLLKDSRDATIAFVVHRDRDAGAAVIEIQNQTLVLKQGEWSSWITLDFGLSTPAMLPEKHLSGICRFYLQEAAPCFRLYVSPININPARPAMQIAEPSEFAQAIARRLGLFATTGFQEDHKALSNKIFTDEEFGRQADFVLHERMNLLDYALQNYDDGLLFFYFSSTDLQSHMFWWDGDAPHPARSRDEAVHYFNCLKNLYVRMDGVVGDLLKRYGERAHLMVMSDHGFSNFARQFNLNTWLRDNGYLGSPDSASIMDRGFDWSKSRAFGLGINSLYLNLKGRERYGTVDPGPEREGLLEELARKLVTVRDVDGRQVIRAVHRADTVYAGAALRYAPDLIIGYSRDFRASWKTVLGDMTDEVLLDNPSAWSADHCMDASEVPGILFSNRPITAPRPSLVDLAPSILTGFGLEIPPDMTGRNIFKG
jgi:predicted AlkP superfamily phosphohydrolase/phosphomutase